MLGKIFKYSYVSPARLFTPSDAKKLGILNKNILRNLRYALFLIIRRIF